MRKSHQGPAIKCRNSPRRTTCPRTAVRRAAPCNGAGVRRCVHERAVNDCALGYRVLHRAWTRGDTRADADADVDINVRASISSRLISTYPRNSRSRSKYAISGAPRHSAATLALTTTAHWVAHAFHPATTTAGSALTSGAPSNARVLARTGIAAQCGLHTRTDPGGASPHTLVVCERNAAVGSTVSAQGSERACGAPTWCAAAAHCGQRGGGGGRGGRTVGVVATTAVSAVVDKPAAAETIMSCCWLCGCCPGSLRSCRIMPHRPCHLRHCLSPFLPLTCHALGWICREMAEVRIWRGRARSPHMFYHPSPRDLEVFCLSFPFLFFFYS